MEDKSMEEVVKKTAGIMVNDDVEIKLLMWNVHGLPSLLVEGSDKNDKFMAIVNNYDVLGLVETMMVATVPEINGFDLIANTPARTSKPGAEEEDLSDEVDELHDGPAMVGGRGSGGIAVFRKTGSNIQISIDHRGDDPDLTRYVIWCDMTPYCLGVIYIPHMPHPPFEKLSAKVGKLGSKKMVLVGDINARTASPLDLNELPENDKYMRQSRDKETNRYAVPWVNLCRDNELVILNGRAQDDVPGRLTFCNVGGKLTSTLDYCAVTSSMPGPIKFQVVDITDSSIRERNYLSDHYPLGVNLPK